MAEQLPVNGDSKQGHDARSIPPDLLFQGLSTGFELHRRERFYAGSWPFDEVGQTDAPGSETCIVHIGQWLVDQSGIIQELPKSIGVSGKMMAQRGGTETRVDADEQDPQTGPEVIW